MRWRDLHEMPRERLAGGALVVLAAAMSWQATRLPVGTLASPGPGYWPLLLSIALGLLAIVIILNPSGAPIGKIGWTEAPRAGLVLASCAFAAALLEHIGYRLTVFAVLMFLLGGVERRPPLAALAVSIAVAWGSFFLFADLLRVALPRGPWGV